MRPIVRLDRASKIELHSLEVNTVITGAAPDDRAAQGHARWHPREQTVGGSPACGLPHLN
jgi:hypothetical protein